MSEALAARIVADRYQHRLLAAVLVSVVGFLGLMLAAFLLVMAKERMETGGGPYPPGFVEQQAAEGQSYLILGVAVVVGVLVLCVAIYAIALRLRRNAIQRIVGLLEHGVRLDARVVQARRVSMTQLRVAVHVNGPVAPFSELISTHLDEAAFVNRAVVVACDRTNPAWYVLVPSW